MHAWQNFGVRHNSSLMSGVYFGTISESGALSSSAATSGASLITPSVAVSRANGSGNLVAPLAVHFDAAATTAAAWTSRPFHDLEYRWDFGDEVVTTWSYGSQPGIFLKNVAFGPVSAHVYESAGTFTPTLQVRFRKTDGTFDTTSYTCPSLTIISADTEFAGTKTICVSTSGDFTGAPSGHVPVTSSNATTALSGNIGDGNKRILFRRGETFGVAASMVVDKPGPCLVGAFGTGAKPILNRTANVTLMNWSRPTTPTTVYDWRFQDLVLEGGSFSGAGVSGEGSCKRMLMLGCELQNQGYGLTFSGSLINGLNASVPFTHAMWDEIYFVNSKIYNIIGTSGPCGIFGGFDRVTVLGSSIDNNGGGEHGYRTQYTNRAVLSHNTIQGIAVGKANLSIRGGAFGGDNTSVAGLYSEKNVVSYNDLVGGASGGIMGIGPQNSYNDERGRDMIVECNLYRGTASTTSVNTCAQPDITYRFNTALMSSGSFLSLEKSNLVPVPTNVGVYNNTLYGSGSGGFGLVTFSISVGTGFDQSPAGSSTLTARNNLVYAPGVIGYSAIFSNPEGAGAITESNNSSTAQMFGTPPPFTTQPPTTIAHCKPTSGYAVGGGATGANRVQGRYFDILGVAIPSTSDIGAVAA